MSENIYVFVVCGAREHIETLHFSLRYLKHFSKNEIWVVTDSSRNEMPVVHEKIIEIKTPTRYNHHQASIYIKTGLHKFLPVGNNYCYLDTDVVVLDEACDEIFDQFISPIRFAADHCLVHHFSPHAINCNCISKIGNSVKLLYDFLEKQQLRTINDERLLNEAKLLEKEFEKIQKSFLRKIFFSIKFLLPLKKIKLDNRFYFDKLDKAWKLLNGETVMFEINIKEMEKKTGFRFIKDEDRWVNTFGEEIWIVGCDHLIRKIYTDFKIKIPDNQWQHWNGGVFLFNDNSRPFLEAWHQKTLKIFDLPDWKTRDQGTLIATAWEFNLQNHPVLDKKWNFLADDNNLELGFNTAGFFTENNWKTQHKVILAHIYHRFGDSTWDLWNFIANKSLNDN